MAWRNEWIMNTTLFSSDQMCLVVSLNFLGTDFALLNDRGMKHIRICLNCLLLQLPLIHSVDILNWHAKASGDILFSGLAMATSGGTCGDVDLGLLHSASFLKFPIDKPNDPNREIQSRLSFLLLLTGVGTTLGFKEVLFLERTLELSCRERERVQKRPRLSACLSVGETILDGEEAVDGAGESKGGKSPMQDDGSESLSSSQEFAEKGKEDSAKKEVYTERFKSIDTRVEEVEDARCDESGKIQFI
uniref:Predicted protein n=1 Tax=Physcomitrium patens TaxID=3218 RepID=A9U4N8_PHYPA